MGEILDFDTSKLTAKQQEVLTLLVSGHSPAETAKKANVGIQTVYNWRSKRFGKLEKQLVAERFTDAITQVRSLIPEVIDSLKSIVSDTSVTERDRISASRELLDLCGLKNKIAELSDEPESDEAMFDNVLSDMVAEVVLKHHAAN